MGKSEIFVSGVLFVKRRQNGGVHNGTHQQIWRYCKKVTDNKYPPIAVHQDKYVTSVKSGRQIDSPK